MKIDIQSVVAIFAVLAGFGSMFGYVNQQDQKLTVLQGQSISVEERMKSNSDMDLILYRLTVLESKKN